jgi:hypothetical protein
VKRSSAQPIGLYSIVETLDGCTERRFTVRADSRPIGVWEKRLVPLDRVRDQSRTDRRARTPARNGGAVSAFEGGPIMATDRRATGQFGAGTWFAPAFLLREVSWGCGLPRIGIADAGGRRVRASGNG